MHRLGEWFRAQRRGDKRVASKAVRGRVYVRRGDEGAGNRVHAKAEPEARISTRVFRAETGKWEDLGVIAGPTQRE